MSDREGRRAYTEEEVSAMANELRAETERAYQYLRTFRSPTHAMIATMTALDMLARSQEMDSLHAYVEIVLNARLDRN